MAELNLHLAVTLLQIYWHAQIIFAADDGWLTELQERMEILEKQGVKQGAINLRQQEMLEEQARKLEYTNDLVLNLQKRTAAQNVELEKQRYEIDNLNEHVRKLSKRIVEQDAELDVLVAGIVAPKAEHKVNKDAKVKLPKSAVNKQTSNILLAGEEAGDILKKPNDFLAFPRSAITAKRKPSRDVTNSSGSRMIKRPGRFVLNREGPFAFHAVSDKPEISHLQVGQSILFETVLTNIGGAYHSNHSLFIAEMPGVYLFSVSILSYVNDKSEYTAALVKNGRNLALIYGHGDAGRHDQGSVTVVTQLDAGNEVWVKLLSSADDSIYGGRYTTFSGVLLNHL